MMYEIWSLGHKPFEDLSTNEVYINTCTSILAIYHIHNIVHGKDHNWIQTPTTSWLSQSYV